MGRSSGGVGGAAPANQYGVPQLGLQNSGTFGGGASAADGIGTLNVGASRRSAQRFLGGGASSGRSATDNRSTLGAQQPPPAMGASGGTSLGVGFSRANEPTYSQHMGSKEASGLEFVGTHQQ